MGGPDFDRPLAWLQTMIAPTQDDIQLDGKDWVFSFRNDQNPSQMAHGQRVISPVGIGNLLSDFWNGRRQVNGRVIDIVQYAQLVDLKFNGIEWPHVAVNTLIKN